MVHTHHRAGLATGGGPLIHTVSPQLGAWHYSFLQLRHNSLRQDVLGVVAGVVLTEWDFVLRFASASISLRNRLGEAGYWHRWYFCTA